MKSRKPLITFLVIAGILLTALLVWGITMARGQKKQETKAPEISGDSTPQVPLAQKEDA